MFTKGEIAGAIPIAQDSFAQRLGAFLHDPQLQKNYRLLVFTLSTQEAPYEVLVPPCDAHFQLHPLQSLMHISEMLRDIEYVNIQLQLTAAPPETNLLISYLQKHVDVFANPAFASYRSSRQPHSTHQKSLHSSPLFFCGLHIAALVKAANVSTMQSLIQATFEGFRFGSNPLQIANMEDYLRARISLDALCTSLFQRISHKAGLLLTLDELGHSFPLPNLKMLEGSKIVSPMIHGDRVPRAYADGHDLHLGVNPIDGRPLKVNPEDTVPGFFLIGAPNAGKSTEMFRLIQQFSTKDGGMLIIMPHATMEEILAAVGKDHWDRCIILDPFSEDSQSPPVGINPLVKDSEVRSGLVHCLKSLSEGNPPSSTDFGPQMEELTEKSFKLFAHLGGTLAHVHRALADEDYLRRAMEFIDDYEVDLYFNHTLPSRKKYGRDSNTSVTNRLEPFVGKLKHLFCQLQPRMTYNELVNQNKIIILDCHVGLLGEINTAALAGAMVLLANHEVMRRPVTEGARTPFLNVLDECHWYLTEGITSILARGRIYGCRTIAGTQYLNQFSPNVRASLRTCLPIKIAY